MIRYFCVAGSLNGYGCTDPTDLLCSTMCANYDSACTSLCPSGTFGNGMSARDATCTGRCRAGYFCGPGSITNQGKIGAAGSDVPCPDGM